MRESLKFKGLHDLGSHSGFWAFFQDFSGWKNYIIMQIFIFLLIILLFWAKLLSGAKVKQLGGGGGGGVLMVEIIESKCFHDSNCAVLCKFLPF